MAEQATASAAQRAGARPRLVAVLPAYQLEQGIAAIVQRVRAQADHVVVAADGSRDGTAAAARAAGAIVPEPLPLRGKGRALRRGIEAARALDPEFVVLLDADGQHLPEEIPRLLEPLERGVADLVSGSRFLGTLRTSRVNLLGNHVLRILSFLVSGRWISDTETGFRAFRAPVLFGMPLSTSHYEVESEIMLRALHRSLRIVEVPITVPFAVPGARPVDGLRVAWCKLRLGLALKLGLIEA
jgi:glycosyltransferase involved in cell wall biosynthesis